MTKEEARQAILAEWRSWLKAEDVKNPTATDGFIFYQHLLRERPDLLAFKAKGHKWQVVNGWLLSDRLVSD